MVAAVRAEVGADVILQVDANGSYTLADADHLAGLDALDVACFEQPLAPDALVDHARLAAQLQTPIGLDETITSARVAADALDLNACEVVSIKCGLVGGLAEARATHDVCVAAGAAARAGGMLETGVGRAALVALASLPGFTVTGDLSASSRYFEHDLTEPFELDDGALAVPTGPGIGVTSPARHARPGDDRARGARAPDRDSAFGSAGGSSLPSAFARAGCGATAAPSRSSLRGARGRGAARSRSVNGGAPE